MWKSDRRTIKVVLAAISRNFTDQTDNTQVLAVDRIEMPAAYQDHVGNYGSDLAILVLKTPTMITSAVTPICLDWSYSLDVLQRSGQIGFVAGTLNIHINLICMGLYDLKKNDWKSITQCV